MQDPLWKWILHGMWQSCPWSDPSGHPGLEDQGRVNPADLLQLLTQDPGSDKVEGNPNTGRLCTQHSARVKGELRVKGHSALWQPHAQSTPVPWVILRYQDGSPDCEHRVQATPALSDKPRGP